jgi:hypothetical protein
LTGMSACATFIASTALGYPAPSFSIEDAAPRATHIVVATEGDEIDGRLTVIECWKGNLKAQDVILVPQMKAWSRVEEREVLGTMKDFYKALRPELVERLPSHVSCKRIVLFLIRDGEIWMPASKTQMMSMSAVWIEDGIVLRYVQHLNPGPSELCPYSQCMDELKASVAKVMNRPPGDFQANDSFVPLERQEMPSEQNAQMTDGKEARTGERRSE